jgi:hypothetical protein
MRPKNWWFIAHDCVLSSRKQRNYTIKHIIRAFSACRFTRKLGGCQDSHYMQNVLLTPVYTT